MIARRRDLGAPATTSVAARFVGAMLAVMSLGGCTPPPDTAPQLGVTYLYRHGCIVTSRADGAVEALNAPDGTTRWRYRPPQPQSDIGVFPPPYPSCPPQTTADGGVLLPFSSSLAMLEVRDGAVRFEFGYGGQQRWSVCPTVTADSGVVFVSSTPQGLSRVVKLDASGELQWDLVLEGVGIVAGGLSTVAETGEVIVRTARHVINISPTGEVNWTRELEAPPS